MFGEQYARAGGAAERGRGWAKGTLPTYQDRKEFFEGIVNGDPDPVELLRGGRRSGVRRADRRAQRAAIAAARSRRLLGTSRSRTAS